MNCSHQLPRLLSCDGLCRRYVPTLLTSYTSWQQLKRERPHWVSPVINRQCKVYRNSSKFGLRSSLLLLYLCCFSSTIQQHFKLTATSTIGMSEEWLAALWGGRTAARKDVSVKQVALQGILRSNIMCLSGFSCFQFFLRLFGITLDNSTRHKSHSDVRH